MTTAITPGTLLDALRSEAPRDRPFVARACRDPRVGGLVAPWFVVWRGGHGRTRSTAFHHHWQAIRYATDVARLPVRHR